MQGPEFAHAPPLEDYISGRIKNAIKVIKVLSTAIWINHTLEHHYKWWITCKLHSHIKRVVVVGGDLVTKPTVDAICFVGQRFKYPKMMY